MATKTKLTKQATLIRANGVAETIEPKGRRFKLDELQALVGGYIEMVDIGTTGLVMVVNEEGKLRDLPYNKQASVIAHPHVIVGDAVLCRKGLA